MAKELKKVGRPTKYRKEAADEIILAMCRGTTTTKACRSQDVCIGTFLSWKNDDRDGLMARYERAQRDFVQARRWMMLDLLEDDSGDMILDEKGKFVALNSVRVRRHEAIARQNNYWCDGIQTRLDAKAGGSTHLVAEVVLTALLALESQISALADHGAATR